MPSQADNSRLWIPGKSAAFGTALLTDPVNYYGPRHFLLDGFSGGPGSISSLYAWWDFTALGLSNGASVTSVSDSSGNGRTLTNDGAVTYKTGVQNGLGAVNTDNLRRMHWLTTGSFGTHTQMHIWQSATGTTTQTIAGMAGESNRHISCLGGTPQLRYGDGTSVNYTPSAPGTTTHFIMAEFNGASSKLYYDAETAVSTANAGTSGWGAGSNFYQLGDAFSITEGTDDNYVLESAIWQKVLNAGEITALATYIENKYAMTIGA